MESTALSLCYTAFSFLSLDPHRIVFSFLQHEGDGKGDSNDDDDHDGGMTMTPLAYSLFFTNLYVQDEGDRYGRGGGGGDDNNNHLLSESAPLPPSHYHRGQNTSDSFMLCSIRPQVTQHTEKRGKDGHLVFLSLARHCVSTHLSCLLYTYRIFLHPATGLSMTQLKKWTHPELDVGV